MMSFSLTKSVFFSFTVGLLGFLSLLLTVPEAQAQGFDVPPTPSQAEVLYPVSYEKLQDSPPTTDIYMAYYNNDFCDNYEGGSAFNRVFYYDESIEEWIHATSSVGLGNSFGGTGCRDSESYFAYTYQLNSAPEGYYARFTYTEGTLPPGGQPITESIWDNTLVVQLSYWNGEESEIPLEPPSLPGSTTYITMLLPEYGYTEILRDVTVMTEYHLHNFCNEQGFISTFGGSTSSPIIDVVFEAQFASGLSSAEMRANDGLMLDFAFPSWKEVYRANLWTSGDEDVSCRGTFQELEAFELPKDGSWFLRARLVGDRSAWGLLDLEYAISEPTFFNVGGINSYQIETGSETPRNRIEAPILDCGNWDMGCNIQKAIQFLFYPTYSFSSSWQNVTSLASTKFPFVYLSQVVEMFDLEFEEVADRHLSISFAGTVFHEQWDDTEFTMFTTEKIIGENDDNILTPSQWSFWRGLVGLTVLMMGVWYAYNNIRRFNFNA